MGLQRLPLAGSDQAREGMDGMRGIIWDIMGQYSRGQEGSEDA